MAVLQACQSYSSVPDVLQVLFQSVLPVVPTQNIEELLLSKVTAKVAMSDGLSVSYHVQNWSLF